VGNIHVERFWIELDVLDLIEICVARFIAISQGRTTGDFSVWYDGDGLSVAVVLWTRDYLKSSAPGHCPNYRVENVEHNGCLVVAEGDDETGCHQGYMLKRVSAKVKVEKITRHQPHFVEGSRSWQRAELDETDSETKVGGYISASGRGQSRAKLYFGEPVPR